MKHDKSQSDEIDELAKWIDGDDGENSAGKKKTQGAGKAKNERSRELLPRVLWREHLRTKELWFYTPRKCPAAMIGWSNAVGAK